MGARFNPIFRVVGLYLLFSIIWIIGSDRVVDFLFRTPQFNSLVQTYKGIAFVLVSSGLLFSLLQTELEKREQIWQAHLQERDLLLLRLQDKAQELSDAYDATIDGWARALELRNHEVRHHSSRVTEITLGLAARLGIAGEDLDHLRRGALLHDIGKMGIPDAILLKPGSLQPEERLIIQTHPELAYLMLVGIEYLKPALIIPRYHHERWDGSGYPFGLKGEQIPLPARIFAVADVFDALISDRVYRAAVPRNEALDYLQAEAGKLFDPAVVQAFTELFPSLQLHT